MVWECQTDNIIVEFMGNGISDRQVATIKRETFSVFNGKEGKNKATRYQVPLILAYRITIHKAQGMSDSLPHVSSVWHLEEREAKTV